MTVTQDTLIRQIAEKKQIDIPLVREILKAAEDIIFDCLSTTAPSENITVKLLNGVSIERKYVGEREYSKGMFQKLICPEHVNIKSGTSRYYSRQINNKLFPEKSTKRAEGS